ncbi:MAG TPA: exonuclease domain-containing protein [Sphingobacteriaceae bacterium]
MYAIVDIETTGGHASASGITEVAIVIHDGKEIVSRYETLVNPRAASPIFIKGLTGISDEMVASAPEFREVAGAIFELLDGKVFVAHNVNFDYSFLKYHLSLHGYELKSRKLCTVRLGRSILPGLPSYSLGKLCRSLEIPILNRHRAGGDADATARLFSLLLQKDDGGHIEHALNVRSKEQHLPANLPREKIDQLPSGPGVYYFLNKHRKVVYVGKAKNLKRRVNSHFANNNPGKQKQQFLRNIFDIRYQTTASELMAFVLEALEIKKLWPYYNRAQKRFEQAYGLYSFEDQRGYMRLAIDKKRKFSYPIYSFNYLLDGYNLLRKLSAEYELCPRLCHLQKTGTCSEPGCRGACRGEEPVACYNDRVHEAIASFKAGMPTYAIVEQSAPDSPGLAGCILMEEGQFYGMGRIPVDIPHDLNEYKVHLTRYPGNDYIRNLVHNYAWRNPEKRVELA